MKRVAARTRITDRDGRFPSESSVYRILKACDLVAIPACVVMSASDRFQHPTRWPNGLWKMNFTHIRVVSQRGLQSEGSGANVHTSVAQFRDSL